jgi:hypothetical protein
MESCKIRFLGDNEDCDSGLPFRIFLEEIREGYERLKEDRLYLLESTMELSEDFRFQTILAIIVDDGCCKNWMLVVFEDMDKYVVEGVQALWESMFPRTSKIKWVKTKSGKRIYHLFADRNGIIGLRRRLERTLSKYGPFSGLWWKDEQLEARYAKAVSARGRMLNETRLDKEKRESKVMDCVEAQRGITFQETKKLLHISEDRTRTLLNSLRGNSKLELVGHTHTAKYVLKS